MQQYLEAGKVVTTHGVRGEMKLELWCDGVEYLKKTYSPLTVVFRLAQEASLLLLNGGGFDGPEWSVRASLANLNEIDYITIGQGIKRILDEYAKEWEKNLI